MRVDLASFQHRSPGAFIVLEGVNGAGKTTLQQRIAQYLEEHGRTALCTREPGATELGRTLRRILLESSEPVSPLAELLLFAADRAEHVAKVVRPAVERGEAVISDRYYYSTVAFQGFGRGLDADEVAQANQIAIAGTLPDLVILLDLPAEAGLKRTAQRNDGGSDSFEREELAFHQRIRDGFLHLAETCPEPFLVIDASLSPDQVFAAVRPFLSVLLQKKAAAGAGVAS